jgi:hypothetical protein
MTFTSKFPYLHVTQDLATSQFVFQPFSYFFPHYKSVFQFHSNRSFKAQMVQFCDLAHYITANLRQQKKKESQLHLYHLEILDICNVDLLQQTSATLFLQCINVTIFIDDNFPQ